MALAIAAVLGAAVLARGHPWAPAAYQAMPVLPSGQQLEEADLVFRRGTDTVADAVVLGSGDARFSHVGMLVKIHGAPWVVHAAPAEGKAPGGVRLQPLAEFVAPGEAADAAVYRLALSPAQRRAAREYALARRGLPFDADLRYSTDDAMYCTELVLKALASAGVDLRPHLAGRSGIWMSEQAYPPDALRRLSELVEVQPVHAVGKELMAHSAASLTGTSSPAP